MNTKYNRTIRTHRAFNGYPTNSRITVELTKHGDGQVTVTGEMRAPRERNASTCGCIHEEVSKFFPTIGKRLVHWHLFGMHYEANAVYWWEKARGESKWGRETQRDGRTDYDVLKNHLVWGLDSTETDDVLQWLVWGHGVTKQDFVQAIRQRYDHACAQRERDWQYVVNKYGFGKEDQ